MSLELDALLAMLDPDREAAGQKYENLRQRLIRLFEWRQCAHPEDLADETFNRVGRKAVEGLALQRSEPYAYFYGVAHHVYQEYRRKKRREDGFLESGDWPPSAPPEEEPDFRLDSLRECLRVLAAEQRLLLLRYHEDERRIHSRKVLCEELGIPMNALRIRVHRLRKKVLVCVQEKLRRTGP